MNIECKCCKLHPSAIAEYIDTAYEENISPEDYVIDNERTFNDSTGKFYCTKCYIKEGIPLGTA